MIPPFIALTTGRDISLPLILRIHSINDQALLVFISQMSSDLFFTPIPSAHPNIHLLARPLQ